MAALYNQNIAVVTKKCGGVGSMGEIPRRMEHKVAKLLVLFGLCARVTVLLAGDAAEDDRDQQLQAAFLKFPILTPATNSESLPEFQRISLKRPIIINGSTYFGFRFTAPERTGHKDFVWAFVEPPGYVEWCILPEHGTMDGFKNWRDVPKGDYLGTNRLVPLGGQELIVQSLAGKSLIDGSNYLVWMTFDSKGPAMSVAFTFAPLGPKGLNNRRAMEHALGLDRAESQPIVNTNNHHTYILLKSATWKESEARAVALGGHLATVHSQTEEDWLLKTFGSYDGAQRLLWIGLSDRDKKFHFTWSSGESVSFTAWAKGEPNNAGRGEDFVAIYYPNHSQRGKWNDWSDRKSDPIGLPINGVAEISPQNADATTTPAPDATTSTNPAPGLLQAVEISPTVVITSDNGSIKLQWPVSTAHYMLEATTNLNQPFTMLGYSELTNAEAGVIYVTITNSAPQMFFRLRKP